LIAAGEVRRTRLAADCSADVVAETFGKPWSCAIFFFIRVTSKSNLNPDPSLGNQENSVVDESGSGSSILSGYGSGCRSNVLILPKIGKNTAENFCFIKNYNLGVLAPRPP
jgi:hypothetical protein